MSFTRLSPAKRLGYEPCPTCGGRKVKSSNAAAMSGGLKCADPFHGGPLALYRCDNSECGWERCSATNLAIYGTCKACRFGLLRRATSEIRQ
jgi:hypothetical protein